MTKSKKINLKGGASGSWSRHTPPLTFKQQVHNVMTIMTDYSKKLEPEHMTYVNIEVWRSIVSKQRKLLEKKEQQLEAQQQQLEDQQQQLEVQKHQLEDQQQQLDTYENEALKLLKIIRK
jgi:uncharacterized protein HemX